MKDFPEIIKQLSNADVPIEGLSSYLFQGDNAQIIFMQFEKDIEFPEHSHEAAWGVVLSGEMTLFIENQELVLKKGDEYYIPKNKIHSAKIKAGYKDLTFLIKKTDIKLRDNKLLCISHNSAYTRGKKYFKIL